MKKSCIEKNKLYFSFVSGPVPFVDGIEHLEVRVDCPHGKLEESPKEESSPSENLDRQENHNEVDLG